MITIYNNLIPFKGYKAMCVFPFIFVRKDVRSLTVNDINHEKIHGKQQKETLFLLFYLLYGIEWIIKVVYYRNRNTAYKNVSFEREAYDNQGDITYLDKRKLFSWVKYIL